jgi:hypothetical protein
VGLRHFSRLGPRSVAPRAGGAERLRIEAATSRVNPAYLRGHAGVGVVRVTRDRMLDGRAA